jgi:hypothetical protein
MRYGLIVLLLALSCSVTPAAAQVSIDIGLPSVNIGINFPVFPELVVVPDYPVYYAPRLDANFFFYDGLYWVYQGDYWYASSWYNGPWAIVAPEAVPVYILRVPVRYYRHPPVYFRGWRADAPPRWGEHWGRDWEQRRSGWDRWSRGSAPAPAPLPVYQRQYAGDRYPRVEQQQALHNQNYRYQPQDSVARQQYQQHGLQGSPAPPQRGQQQGEPQQKNPKQHATQRSTPPPPQEREAVQKASPVPAPPQQGEPAVQGHRQPPPQGTAQREQPTPKPQIQEKGPRGQAAPAPEESQERRQERKQEAEQGQGQGQEKGQGHNK